MKKGRSNIEKSSGNVFADLGLDDAVDLQAKAGLVQKIAAIIEERSLTQTAAARLLGVDQPRISNLMKGRLEGFSNERIFRFLNALDQDIEIRVKPKSRSRKPAQVRVLVD